MSESAGVISTELRLALDKMSGDINKMNQMFEQIATKSDDTAKKLPTPYSKSTGDISKSFTKMSNGAVNDAARMATGIKASFLSIPIIGWIAAAGAAITALVNRLWGMSKAAADTARAAQQDFARLEMYINNTFEF